MRYQATSVSLGWQRWAMAIVAVAASTVLAACASAPPPPAASMEQGNYDWEREGRIPPVDAEGVKRQADRVDTFEEVAVEETPLSVESVEPAAPMGDPGYAADSTAIEMPGYRIQIFATGDRASAERVQGEASAALHMPAYVATVDGLYKVHVGDCPTRLEAEQLLQQCRALGYPDAWVTAATIRLPRALQ